MITFKHPVIDITNDKIDIRTLFQNSGKPLKVEIGFGNGVFILERAIAEPDINFIGVELYHRGINALAKRIKKSNVENLIIAYADAKKFLTDSLRDNDLTELYINFPDPWPKKRHKKRRLVNANFAKLVYSKMKDKGKIYLATDSENYGKDMLISFEGVRGYKNMAGRLKFAEKLHGHINTKYERKFLSYGKKIYYLQYQIQK